MHRTKPEIHPVAREANFRSEREFAHAANFGGPETMPWQPDHRRQTEPPPTGRRVPRRERTEHTLVGLLAFAGAVVGVVAVVATFIRRLPLAVLG